MPAGARKLTKYSGVCVLCDNKLLKDQWAIVDFESRSLVHTRCRSDLIKAKRESESN